MTLPASDSARPRGRSAVVLGAGTVGLPVIRTLHGDGWDVTAVARSQGSLRAAGEAGARPVAADVCDPQALDAVLIEAAAAHGGLDLLVNAVNATRPPPDAPFAGGPLPDASLASLRGYGLAVIEQVFVALTSGIHVLRAHGGGVLIQITGSSSRRPRPGGGCWAAGAFGARALVEAASQDLRGSTVRVCLLVVEGKIESLPPAAPHCPEHAELGEAVRYLATRSHRPCPELFLQEASPGESAGPGFALVRGAEESTR